MDSLTLQPIKSVNGTVTLPGRTIPTTPGTMQRQQLEQELPQERQQELLQEDRIHKSHREQRGSIQRIAHLPVFGANAMAILESCLAVQYY